MVKTILFSNSTRSNQWGGGEKWMLNAINSLTPEEFKSYLVCRPGSILGKNARETGVTTFAATYRNSLHLPTVYKIYRILRKEKIDVVVCSTLLDVKLAGLAAKIAGIPVISRQGLALFSDKYKYRFLIRNFTSSILTNTLSIQRLYENYPWFPPHHIKVIYNGVETGTGRRIEVPTLLQRQHGRPEEKIILASGRLCPQKGFTYLIETAKLAGERQKKWKFLILGKGELQAELEKQIARYGLTNIRLIGFHSRVNDYYRSADLFVLSSLEEGTPNVVLEAMANRCPVVATVVNGVEEVIENGRNGILVPPRDPESMFKAIDHLFNHPEQLRQIAESGYETVCTGFSNKQFAENFSAYLNEVIETYEKHHYQNA